VSHLCTDQRNLCNIPSKTPEKSRKRAVVECNNNFFVQLYQLAGAHGLFIEFLRIRINNLKFVEPEKSIFFCFI
jgi:hypothetical protein